MESVKIQLWSPVETFALTRKKVIIFSSGLIVYVNDVWLYSAREKFSCGESCIPRTEMCVMKGEGNCSQHYTKCGSVCVEKYEMRGDRREEVIRHSV